MKARFRIAESRGTAGSVRRRDATKNAGRRTTLSTVDLPLLRIEVHESEIPWLKIFVRRPVREFSDCSAEEKRAVWEALDIVERAMLAYYRPAKINIASFGNMLPQVHWHIMARFEEDSFFPEPMWGAKRREAALVLPPMAPFMEQIAAKLAAAASF